MIRCCIAVLMSLYSFSVLWAQLRWAAHELREQLSTKSGIPNGKSQRDILVTECPDSGRFYLEDGFQANGYWIEKTC
jgi:hypothetical protein